MFTGLVEELGSFVSREGDRFRFAASLVLEDAAVDDSISVNGCCLTVVALGLIGALVWYFFWGRG